MLFTDQTLARIKAGEVRVAFRRWKRPTVKAGGTLMTPVGVLEIEAVDRVDVREISDVDVRNAGRESRTELVEELTTGSDGSIYRIRFQWAGPDPRVTLRERTRISGEERTEIRGRLDRLDRASPEGPWTRKLLEVIARNEGVRAGDLASEVGRQKEWVKSNVRKLKNLGLTESLGIGYRISPRGSTVLKRLATPGPPEA